MKTLVVSLVLLSTVAFAQVKESCPIGTQAAMKCTSTPKAGDHEVASGYAKSMTVCSSVSKTFLLIETEKEAKAIKADVEARIGGTSYSISEKGIKLTLGVGGPNGQKTKPGKLTIEIKDAKVKVASSYTCQ